jgi:hypothetical protein
MCSIEIRKPVFPETRADKINSRCHSDKAAPLETRAKTGILKTPIAIIALNALGPAIAVIRIAITKLGNANTKSLNRMTASSIKLPLHVAANNPNGTPKSTPMPTATNATAIDVRAPTIIIDSISLPK